MDIGVVAGLIVFIVFIWIISFFVLDWIVEKIENRFTFFTDETDFEAAKLVAEEDRAKRKAERYKRKWNH